MREALRAHGETDAVAGGHARTVLISVGILARPALPADASQPHRARNLPRLVRHCGAYVRADGIALALAPQQHRHRQLRQQGGDACRVVLVAYRLYALVDLWRQCVQAAGAAQHQALGLWRNETLGGVLRLGFAAAPETAQGPPGIFDCRGGVIQDLALRRRPELIGFDKGGFGVFGLGQAFQALCDGLDDLFGLAARALEQFLQAGLRGFGELPDVAGNVLVQVRRQHADDGVAQACLGLPRNFLLHQEQGRPQAHARRRGARRGDHAEQIDAQADPVRELALLAIAQFDDVAHGVHQRHDVAQHRHHAGGGCQARQGDDVVAVLAQPGVERIGARLHIFDSDRVERRHHALWTVQVFVAPFDAVVLGFGLCILGLGVFLFQRRLVRMRTGRHGGCSYAYEIKVFATPTAAAGSGLATPAPGRLTLCCPR
ncbi:hypothetical protein D3C71_1026030 [compost metagenome]